MILDNFLVEVIEFGFSFMEIVFLCEWLFGDKMVIGVVEFVCINFEGLFYIICILCNFFIVLVGL